MSEKRKYWLLFTSIAGDGAEIGMTFEQPTSNKFSHVKPMAKTFPDNAKIYFSEYNENVKLYDFIGNTNSWLIVSPEVKLLFEDFGVADIEYLKVAVVDHDNKTHTDPYYILNILNQQPIVDLEKSKFRRSPFDGEITKFRNFVTNTDDVDPSIHVFRPTDAPIFYIISNDLKEAMEASGLTNCLFYEADGWNGSRFMEIIR